MNSYTLSLQSTVSNHTETLDELKLEDHTLLSLDLENLYNDVIPLYVKVDWGDGNVETFDNDVYGTRYDNQLKFFNYNPIFTSIHTHEYFPSSTSLYKNITLQVLIRYSDGEHSYFIVPIQIKTYDMVESLGRLEVLNTTIVDNELEYQIQTSNGLIEMVVPRN